MEGESDTAGKHDFVREASSITSRRRVGLTMRRVSLLNALLTMPWTPNHWTSATYHDDDAYANDARDESRTGDGRARNSWRMQEPPGNSWSSVGWD